MSAGCHERLGHDDDSPWVAESRSRYHLAAALAVDGPVLDVACGTGLGLRILDGSTSGVVVGGDLDPEALRTAASTGSPTCRLDATRLPFRDGTFALVTSFETIEHVPDADALLAELARVLRPGATLLLSTPNACFTKPPGGVPVNPFHVKEYEPDELLAVLHHRFRTVRLVGQAPNPRLRPCPYWQLPEHLPSSPRARVDLAAWKALARLGAVGRAMAPLVLRRPLLPDEHGFVFAPEEVAAGHVLVATCSDPQ